MEHKPDTNPTPTPDNHWSERFIRWGQRLRAAHLDGIVGALLDAAEPLGPFGAQLLWVAQPTLGLFVPDREIDSLAHWLDQPGGIARLRAHLVESEEKTEL